VKKLHKKSAIELERRSSTLVPRAKLPAVRRRERLNQLLMAHDLEPGRRPTFQLDDEDWVILRLIAGEGTMTNTGPALRSNAIYYLAKAPTVENLNLLTHLAQHGDDFYVRSQALVALGRTGVHLVAPLLAARLEAEERTERLAAEHALAALGQSAGVGVVRAALTEPKWREALGRVEAMITARSPGTPRRARRTKRATTTPLEHLI
jgi:hypothetical protein